MIKLTLTGNLYEKYYLCLWSSSYETTSITVLWIGELETRDIKLFHVIICERNNYTECFTRCQSFYIGRGRSFPIPFLLYLWLYLLYSRITSQVYYTYKRSLRAWEILERSKLIPLTSSKSVVFTLFPIFLSLA